MCRLNASLLAFGMSLSPMFLEQIALAQVTSKPTSQPVARPAQPETLAKWLVDRLAAGEFDIAVQSFDETMRERLPAERLAKVWHDLEKSTGEFQSAGDPAVRPMGELAVVVLPGTWKKAQLDIQVTMNADMTVAGLFFRAGDRGPTWQKPEYADPDAFEETSVSVGSKPYKLAGKLCLPRGAGPFPGIVLVHGSGPQDRDESIGPNKPFRDLAWGLASRGIASLRYDKRTLTYGDKVMEEGPSASNEVIVDALLALKRLRERPEIDKKATFVVGHSLGGCLAPVIARADGELAGIVILSGTLRNLELVVLEQLEFLASKAGPNQKEAEKNLAELKADFAAMNAGKKNVTDIIMFAPVGYWRDINAQLGETGAKALRDFPGRVLILGGGRDYQIRQVDFDKWRSAAGNRKGVTFRWLPEMNHLYTAGKGPADPGDYEKPGHVDLSVIEGLASWIKSGDYPESKAAATSAPSK